MEVLKNRRGKENVNPTCSRFQVNVRDESTALLALKFPYKLWRMVHECRTGAIGWNTTGNAVIVDCELFKRDYLAKASSSSNDRKADVNVVLRSRPTPSSRTNKNDDVASAAFKTSNLSSFIRQMNLYGFHKSTCRISEPIDDDGGGDDEDEDDEDDEDDDLKPAVHHQSFPIRSSSQRGHAVHVFRHHLFVRGRADLLDRITRNTARRRPFLTLSSTPSIISRSSSARRRLSSTSLHSRRMCERRVPQLRNQLRSRSTKKSMVVRYFGEPAGQPLPPLTSRKIVKCQKALTEALDRASYEWEMKQAFDKSMERESIFDKISSPSSPSSGLAIVMDGETEQLLDACVEQHLNYDLADNLNDEFPLQWDCLCDWQSTINELDNEDSFYKDNDMSFGSAGASDKSETGFDFKTIDGEAIGLQQYSQNNTSHLANNLEDSLNVAAQCAEQPWTKYVDNDFVDLHQLACSDEKIYEIFASDASGQNWNTYDQFGAYGQEGNQLHVLRPVPDSQLQGCILNDSHDDHGPRRRLTEMAAMRPDLTQELYVHIDDDYEVVNISDDDVDGRPYYCHEEQHQRLLNMNACFHALPSLGHGGEI